MSTISEDADQTRFTANMLRLTDFATPAGQIAKSCARHVLDKSGWSRNPWVRGRQKGFLDWAFSYKVEPMDIVKFLMVVGSSKDIDLVDEFITFHYEENKGLQTLISRWEGFDPVTWDRLVPWDRDRLTFLWPAVSLIGRVYLASDSAEKELEETQDEKVPRILRRHFIKLFDISHGARDRIGLVTRFGPGLSEEAFDQHFSTTPLPMTPQLGLENALFWNVETLRLWCKRLHSVMHHGGHAYRPLGNFRLYEAGDGSLWYEDVFFLIEEHKALSFPARNRRWFSEGGPVSQAGHRTRDKFRSTMEGLRLTEVMDDVLLETLKDLLWNELHFCITTGYESDYMVARATEVGLMSSSLEDIYYRKKANFLRG